MKKAQQSTAGESIDKKLLAPSGQIAGLLSFVRCAHSQITCLTSQRSQVNYAHYDELPVSHRSERAG